jgi:formamidopyrimidine-DNA glycosylase
MPELPEVETIVRQLNKEIVGKIITHVEVKDRKIAKFVGIERLNNIKIIKVGRRGKLLLFYLSNKQVLMVHLKMTGKFFWGLLPDQHTRVIFWLGKKPLVFNDTRRFGYMELIKEKELANVLINKFGPEILSLDFKFENFKNALLKKKKSKIKSLLLDQKFIAGIGNIYAQEGCFCAGIHPERLVGSLSDTEIKKLLICLKKIMNKAVELGGTTADDYVNLYNEAGGYAKYLKVYGRTGLSCKKCGSILLGKKINGRGTVYCEKCQT